MFEGYGEDNSELWQKSDHTQTGGGFWMQDEGGSLNAVYHLLRSLGVRWFMPGEVGEVVPRMDTVSIDNLERDTTIRPDYPLRYSNWYNYSGFPGTMSFGAGESASIPATTCSATSVMPTVMFSCTAATP